MDNKLSRRSFLSTLAAGSASFLLARSEAFAQNSTQTPVTSHDQI
jgi:hypothetical protein